MMMIHFATLIVGPPVRLVAIVTMAMTVSVVADADEASDAMRLRDDVLEWVDELDAPELARRKSAERALIESGPKALPLLPKKSDTFSAEAAERLERVRTTLQAFRAKAELADLRIDISDVATLDEALEAISRDSGVEFEYRGDGSIAVRSSPTPLAFWHALDLVLDQTRLDVNFYGGDRETLMLVPRQEGRPDRVDTAAYTGVYRLEPTAVTARRVLNQPSLSGMNISLEISWEPRVTPIGLTIPITEVTARLDDGALLQPQSSGDTIDVATSSDIAFSEFFLPLELPAGKPSKLTELSGVIRALLPGKRQRFEVNLIGPETTKTIDSMTVDVEQARPNGPLHEVRVAVKLENADRSLESHRQWIFDNEAFVVAADGTRLEHLGYEVYRQTSDGVGIGYLFDLGGNLDDMTFVYVSPTAVIQNEVSFMLQDVPLP